MQKQRFSEEELASARGQLNKAFALTGLHEDGKPKCPIHRRVHSSAFSIKGDRWYCFSAGKGGDAISLVVDNTDLSFQEAVRALLGVPGRNGKIITVDPSVVTLKQSKTIVSKVDSEIYEALIRECNSLGGLEVAQKFYGRWYIAPEFVSEAGCTYLTKAAQVYSELISQFGRERIIKSGLMTEAETRRASWMVSRNYPVIEPHISPDGRVVGLQFRASEKQEARIKAHRDYTERKAAGEANLEEVPYVPKFLSLAGVDREKSLIGGGLPRLAELPAGTKVYIVEGIKDQMAARTMGMESYSLPGTSMPLPEVALEVLAPLNKVVALDGDPAGVAAKRKVCKRFFDAGQTNTAIGTMPENKDFTDILVERRTAK